MAKDSTAKAWESLNKGFGGDSGKAFFRASEPTNRKWEVFEYPSVGLGSATGVWGAPRGCITQLHGKPGCGKSFLAMLAIVSAQRADKKSEQVWADAETQCLKPNWLKWAKILGIDLERLHVIDSNNGAEIFTKLCGKVNKEGKMVQPGVLEMTKTGDLSVNMVIIDSIATMVPPAEENRGFDDMEMASLARFMPKALRITRPKLVAANVAMICINHLRESMNGGPGTFPGGTAYAHSLDWAIRLHASTASDGILEDANGKRIGHKVIATVEKSRGSVNKHQAEFWLDFTKGVVKQGEELAALAAGCGVVERPNLQMWKYGEHNVRGKDNFAAILDKDEGLRKEILDKVKKQRDSGVDVVAELGDEAKAEAALKGGFAD